MKLSRQLMILIKWIPAIWSTESQDTNSKQSRKKKLTKVQQSCLDIVHYHELSTSPIVVPSIPYELLSSSRGPYMLLIVQIASNKLIHENLIPLR